MAARDRADPAKTRQAVVAIADWLRDETRPAPDRDELARRFDSPRARWPQWPRRQRRGPDPAFCRGAMRFRAQAHPGHTTQCRGDRSADVAAAGYRAVAARRGEEPPGR